MLNKDQPAIKAHGFIVLELLLMICLLLLGIFHLNGQERTDPEAPDWLLQISADSEMQSAPGWKARARWENELSKRGLRSNISTRRIWQESILNYDARKKNAATNKREQSWTPIGPKESPTSINPESISGTGRINTITFHPDDPDVMWIGGGQGGIWKTTNGARSWIPIGDDLPVMRISDIALNPNDPDEMYLSLGDYAYIGFGLSQNDRKRNFHFGLGVYKTMDGGETWQPTGLMRDLKSEDLSLTRRVFVNKANDNLVLAAGTRGIWRSTNRGATFEQINDLLYWDIEQDPSDENILYASSGFIRTLATGRSALWKSLDFGLTWEKLPTMIPEVDTVQRIEIGISSVDPNLVYLVAADLRGGLYGFYRSIDGGSNWEMRANSPNILHWSDGSGQGGQGNYDLAILPDPEDLNRVYISGVNHWITEDGGSTWNGASYWVASHGPSVHADHHFLAYNELDKYYYLCHDGGVSRTLAPTPGSWEKANSDDTYEWPTQWEHLNNGLANMSFYRLGLSSGPQIDVFAGAQDMGTFLKQGDDWFYTTVGDGMECIIHPQDNNILYGSTQFGNIFRSLDGGNSLEGIPLTGDNWDPEFASWTTPFKMDPNNPNILYVPASNVWVSTTGGDSFEIKSNFQNEFPITGFAVAESDPNVMYVGKRVWYGLDQPGQAFRTTDGGKTWIDITSGIPDDLIINYIEVDYRDPLRVWIVFGSFGEGRKVYESRDGGDNWINISLNLPNLPANCIIQHHASPDANNPIYIGMDRGIYYKTDDTDTWMLYAEDLPNVIVSELEIHEGSQQLFAATFGRGVWRAPLIHQLASSVDQHILNASTLNVNPNPNHGQFRIEIDQLEPGDYQAQIVDVTGRKVFFDDIHINGIYSRQIESRLLSGIYYLRLTKGNAQRSMKFVVTD